MNWLIIVIVAYFLNASATTIDKFLLTKKIPNPAVYAFFISALSLIAVVLAPFGMHWVSLPSVGIALVAGAVFAFALLYMFKAFAGNEVSRVTPFMGGVQPILVLVLAWFFLGEVLSLRSILAFAVIIAGTVIISWQKGKASRRSYLLALVSTALFAIAYTMNKFVFDDQGFITGFVWTRVGAFLGALLIIIPAVNRRDVMAELRNSKKKGKRQTGALFLIGQACGAVGFILINYAIAISTSVALVNALQGLQYVFLLVIVAVLAFRFPKVLKEKFTPGILVQKVVSVVLIVIGLVLLSI